MRGVSLSISPLGDIQRMSEYFRRVVIKFFLKKELISARMATSLINGSTPDFPWISRSAFRRFRSEPGKPCPNTSPAPLYP